MITSQTDDMLGSESHSVALALMERRNKQLAAMLDETVNSLKVLASGKLEADKDESLQLIEIAAAKAQFVKVYLEDSSLVLPEEELPPIGSLRIASVNEISSPTVALRYNASCHATSSAVETVRSALSSPASDKDPTESSSLPRKRRRRPHLRYLPTATSRWTRTCQRIFKMSHQPLGRAASLPDAPAPTARAPAPTSAPEPPKPQRPSAPIPTRSTLAQSSFSLDARAGYFHICLAPSAFSSRSPNGWKSWG